MSLRIPQDIEALQGREARFRTIFEEAFPGVALMDSDAHIMGSNLHFQEILGHRQEELHSKVFTPFTRPEDVIRCQRMYRELVDGQRPSFQVEIPYMHRDGRVLSLRLSFSNLMGARVEEQFAVCMLEDITDQKRAEKDIREEQLRSVVLEMSLTEEQERRRLATDLHDTVGQTLALAQIKLGAIREAAASTHLADHLDDIRRLLKQAIGYTRSLIFELSPPILYDLGFEDAMEWLGESIQERQGINIKVQADRSSKPLNEKFRVLLFRFLRELLGNIIKYGNPRHIKVSIAREKSILQVRVEDDGIGIGTSHDFPVDAPVFLRIREHLEYLGGSLKVQYEPGWGTKVTLGVPLKYCNTGEDLKYSQES